MDREPNAWLALLNRNFAPQAKPLVVDGIVVEHVIALKIPGVVDEVVVDGVLAHGNGRVVHRVLQVDRAVPLGAGINFPLRDHLAYLLSDVKFVRRSRSGQCIAPWHTTLSWLMA